MLWGPMETGILLRRYKRFLADIQFEDGRVETVHCPNTGAMTGCCVAGSAAWCSFSGSATRKYPRTLEVIEQAGDRIVVNTSRANDLIHDALRQRSLAPLLGYDEILREVSTFDGSGRVDFLLRHQSRPACYVEVKSVTWMQPGGEGLFPDAVSRRATKHLDSLGEAARAGNRAVVLFCVQHSAIKSVAAANAVDPAFGESLQRARLAGVEVYAFNSVISKDRLELGAELKCD